MTLYVESQDVFRDMVRHFFYNPDARQISGRGTRQGFRIVLGAVAAPLDPFRWGALQTLVSSPRAVRLLGRREQERIPDHALYSNGREQRRLRNYTLGQTSANPLDAGGITIPGRWIVTAVRSYSGIASLTNEGFAIYRTGSTSAGPRDVGSLPHELFGHSYLSVLGAPHRHGDYITAAHGVPSPFASIPYDGSVDLFLSRLVAHYENPTYRVGTGFLDDARRVFRAEFAALPTPLNVADLLHRSALLNAWRDLGVNHAIMEHVRDRAGQAMSDGLLAEFVAYFNGLTGTKRTDFQRFVHRFQLGNTGTDIFASRANSFSSALARRIPAPPPNP